MILVGVELKERAGGDIPVTVAHVQPTPVPEVAHTGNFARSGSSPRRVGIVFQPCAGMYCAAHPLGFRHDLTFKRLTPDR